MRLDVIAGYAGLLQAKYQRLQLEDVCVEDGYEESLPPVSHTNIKCKCCVGAFVCLVSCSVIETL